MHCMAETRLAGEGQSGQCALKTNFQYATLHRLEVTMLARRVAIYEALKGINANGVYLEVEKE